MDFPFSLFSDLLAEFQKYLTDRISRPVYWALGLVVVTLGIITGSIVGWGALLDAWNKTDTSYKLVLSGAAVVIFLLLAYLLGRLQGTVDRWFQGDWLIWWSKLTGQLERHRAIWDGREGAFQQMGDLYAAISVDLNDMTQWGRPQDSSLQVLQMRRALPCYAIITDKDLEVTTVATVPPGALRDLQAIIGMMVQHPINAGTIVTDADVIRLPAGLDTAMITALSVSSLIVPAGLIPGDRIVIYARESKQEQITALNAALIVAVQQLSREENKGTKADFVHFTLAVAPGDIASFGMLSNKCVQRIVRLASPSANPPSEPTTANRPSAPAGTDLQDLPPDIRITEQINTLDRQYKAGQQWLKHLQEGALESKIPPHMEALNEAFKLIESRATTASAEQLEDWRSKANNYRYGWIRLLGDAFKEMEYRIDQHQKAFYLYYPATREKVAATTIGNVFRAVDSYCDKLYGLDLALVLPRLQAVMEQDTRDQLTKAHDQLALFEWLYLGSIAIGIIGTILAFFYFYYWLSLLLWLLVLPVPQLIFYPAALTAALDYAAALRLAIDRERGKVINLAGFSLPSPTNQEQEKELWKQIQRWWVYGTAPGEYNLEGTSSEHNT